MICRPSKRRSSDHHLAILRLSGNAPDQEALEAFLHDHLWIIEEELRTSIGLPPWFDSALSFVVAEIVRDLTRHKAPMKRSARWIRAKARRATEMLEPTLARHRTQNGFVKFSCCESFTAIVGSALERKRSLYWEELRFSQPASPRCEPLGGGD